MKIMLPLEQWTYYGEYGELAGEMYLDVNYTTVRALGLPVNMSLFVNNALGNTEPVGMVVNNGIWYPRDTNLGFKVTYSW